MVHGHKFDTFKDEECMFIWDVCMYSVLYGNQRRGLHSRQILFNLSISLAKHIDDQIQSKDMVPVTMSYDNMVKVLWYKCI